jgi:hypothetical protein
MYIQRRDDGDDYLYKKAAIARVRSDDMSMLMRARAGEDGWARAGSMWVRRGRMTRGARCGVEGGKWAGGREEGARPAAAVADGARWMGGVKL